MLDYLPGGFVSHEIHRALFRGGLVHAKLTPGRPKTGICILSHIAVLAKKALWFRLDDILVKG